MTQNIDNAKRLKFALATVGVLASVGAITAAQAAQPKTSSVDPSLSGYTKDQCKNGGWQTFKNADGSPMFKNQGDCVSYFATGGKNPPNG